MPSLITQTEKDELSLLFEDVFDTFSRNIIIYKESQKIPNSSINSSNFVYGFGESQVEESFTYVEVTGIYPAKIRYKKDQEIKFEKNSNVFISEGEVSIKVRKDCRDFINNGKTTKIVFDDKNWLIESDEKKRQFLDSEFYVFNLKVVK